MLALVGLFWRYPGGSSSLFVSSRSRYVSDTDACFTVTTLRGSLPMGDSTGGNSQKFALYSTYYTHKEEILKGQPGIKLAMFIDDSADVRKCLKVH